MNWRSIPPAPYSLWQTTISLAGGPDELASREAWQAAGELSGLALAQMKWESRFGTEGIATTGGHNPLGLRPKGGGDGFARFSSWPDAIRNWHERITDPDYAYAPAVTLADYIAIYSPDSDNSPGTEAAYVRSIERDLDAWGLEPKETPVPKYKIVGLPGDGIELPVPLAHDIIPASQIRQRPGIPRQLPGFWVQHETDNHAPGADAEMHNRYLHNGAEGRQASWHFTVDDGIIYQHIPIDEVTWQAADGTGPGNMSGISCELCVNAGIDTTKSRHNAEALCGGIMKALNMGIDRCKAHIDFNAGTADRHHCPDTMLDDGYWPGPFKANVQRVLATEPAPPAFADPAPVTWEEGDVGDQTLDGRPALAFLIEVEVNRKVVTPQVSDTDERPTGIPRKKTTKLRAIGSYRGSDRNGWIVLRDGSRLKRTDVRPLVPLPERAA